MEFHWWAERNQISLVTWANITLCIQTQFTSVGGLYDILVMKQQCHLTRNATKYPLHSSVNSTMKPFILFNIIFTHFNSIIIVIRDYFPLSFTKFCSVLSLGVMDLATNSWRWLFITGVQLWQHSCRSHLLNCVLSHPGLPFCSVYLFCFSLLCKKPPLSTPHHSEVCLLLPCSKQGNQHHGQSCRADCSVWLRLHALRITGAHDVWGMNIDFREAGFYLLVT